MLDSSFVTSSLPRLLSSLLLLSALLFAVACNGLVTTHRKVQVPQLLTPLAEANKSQLINEVNRLAGVRSIHGKIDIQFEDTSFAESGVAEKYRQADGTITLQRSGKIYLIIQVPFIAKDIAQMTSDGQSFRLAVLQGDEKYRRFVKGTNNATYQKLDLDGAKREPQKRKKTMNDREAVSALSNLRPQHLTDALMIPPIATSSEGGVGYSQSEFFQEEADSRPEAKKGARVLRGYYLLEEFSSASAGEASLQRRFWFDRVGTIHLARLQTFDDRGLLITDVFYSDEKPFAENGQTKLPSRFEITRPHDQYKLAITFQSPGTVELDREYRPEAFVLENRWQLPEVDLDASRNKGMMVHQ